MTDANDLPCQELVELITDYLEGALPERECERVEAHLRVCPPCVVVIEQFREVARLAGRVGEHDVDQLDPGVRASLLDVFRSSRGDG